jgi:hypothetical protein
VVEKSSLKKDSVHYDMKSHPSCYVHATYLLALLAEGSVYRGLEFCPLRTSSIPCHVKLDTEAIAQCFVPYKEAVKARKDAPDREAYNDWVWSFILDRNKVNCKSRKYRFHREITMDGVVASLLFSREVKVSEKSETETNKYRFHREITTDGVVAYLLFSREVKVSEKSETETNNGSIADMPARPNIYPGRNVGLDPGKRNIASMVDDQGLAMKVYHEAEEP